jgi:hypothetical protein
VERNLNLVYFAALRRTNGDTHLAEDAVQQVFSSLAQNARSVSRHAVPAGWLYATLPDNIRAEYDTPEKLEAEILTVCRMARRLCPTASSRRLRIPLSRTNP